MRALCTMAVVCAVSCASPEQSATSRPPEQSCKPEAPVVVEVSATAVKATPTSDVAELELAVVIDGVEHETLRFGATGAGETRTMTFDLAHGMQLAGVARVPVGGVTMARTALLDLAPPPPPRTRRYALDDGDLAEEIRP